MTDESVEPVESVEEAATPSLEEIAQEFSVEEQVNSFQAQPQYQQPQAQQPWLPDPVVDPDAFKSYALKQNEALTNINQVVQTLNSKIQLQEEMMAKQALDAEVNNAVSKVNEKLQVDPDMAEVALRMEYEKNPSFKKIWDNRSKNPAAFNKALDAIANKYSNKFSIKQDHQLTQNQLAAKKSLQTMAKAPSKQDTEWENLSDAEFQQKWAAYKRG